MLLSDAEFLSCSRVEMLRDQTGKACHVLSWWDHTWLCFPQKRMNTADHPRRSWARKPWLSHRRSRMSLTTATRRDILERPSRRSSLWEKSWSRGRGAETWKRRKISVGTRMKNEKSIKLDAPPWLERNESDKGVLFEMLDYRSRNEWEKLRFGF